LRREQPVRAAGRMGLQPYCWWICRCNTDLTFSDCVGDGDAPCDF
jgi:hypothetical protein